MSRPRDLQSQAGRDCKATESSYLTEASGDPSSLHPYRGGALTATKVAHCVFGQP